MKTRILLPIGAIAAIAASAAGRQLKVLAIGNSFSADALEQHLSPLARGGGHELTIGNLFIPGCTIGRHLENARSDAAAYSYRKIAADGRADTIASCTLSRALVDEDWDIITFQQASAVSGKYDSYAGVGELLGLVRGLAGEGPEFRWHMTWAYDSDSDHHGFANYGRDRHAMYDSIAECCRRVTADNPGLKGVIPCGTAIENARCSLLGENLTRDGYHLSLGAGRFTASCTWYEAIFGEAAGCSSYAPPALSADEADAARKAASAAFAGH